MNTVTLSLIVVLLAFPVENANILGVFPTAGRSVNILFQKLMQGMANAGHNVTMISSYENKFDLKNGSFRDIILTGFAENYEKLLKAVNLFEWNEFYDYGIGRYIAMPIVEACNKTLSDPGVQKLLKSNETFDLIVKEDLYTDSLKIFGDIYGCPVVTFVCQGVSNWVNSMMGASVLPSYVPHYYMSDTVTDYLSFSQRLDNFLHYVYDYVALHWHILPAHREVLNHHFPNPPDMTNLYSNVSLVLLGSHPSLRQSIPLAPNMIEIGGFHIDPPKALPQDLQILLDGATEGAIYFSMGTHLKSTDLTAERKQIFLNVFRELKQKVFWKFEEDMPEKPDNVYVRKWFPQSDVLAHPNVKLFITHGGYGSTLEATSRGVPCLVIPVYLDQFHNANEAVRNGIALKISYQDKAFSEETIRNLIHELLTNSRYSENAKYRQSVFHDRPTNPLDTAIYWMEYVIRHKGAPHLRLDSMSLPWYILYSVDVIAFLIAVSLVAFSTLFFCAKLLLRTIRKTFNKKIKIN